MTQPYTMPPRDFVAGAPSPAGSRKIVLIVLAAALVVLGGTVGALKMLAHRAAGAQRDRAALRIELRNAATAEEVWATDHDGEYTPRLADLVATKGGPFDPGVTITVVRADRSGYCLGASGKAGRLYFDSTAPRVSPTPCG